MKTLKESLLDDEEDIVNDMYIEDPKYFKEKLLKFIQGKHTLLNFDIKDIITLCEDIYYSKFGPNMTIAQCEELAESSNIFMFTDLAKIDESARNYIIIMLNKILYANKGLFGINCPSVKNNYSFADPSDGFFKKDLPYPGIKEVWNIMFDLPNGIGAGKIKLPIIDVMKELGVINKSTESYSKSTKYKVILNNTPFTHEQLFSIMWIPSTLPSNYKKMIEILFKELK